eukprot:TRINITY_DN2886_c0_g1_i1.p1 TRINITY_DN2886_c0_g1~~TRINITY_DN2886_c0_g1_i1.p1  ORF type:complete len:142 (-),score=21.32 TRINITY_DN2886_c0_g1_i1:503-928(-)
MNSMQDNRLQEWRFGFFDCFSDCETCCVSLCCPCHQYGWNMAALDGEEENYLKHCLSFWFSGFVRATCFLGCIRRDQMRQKYALQGHPVTDFLAYLCCPCCALTQEAREIRFRENLVQQGIFASAPLPPTQTVQDHVDGPL